MELRRAPFIVIDGADATGKKTQTIKLVDRLVREGIPARRLEFPRYTEDSSWFVRAYLGRLQDVPAFVHSPEAIGPYAASMFYAIDRAAAASDIRSLLASGTTVVCDRYVTANMGHQGALIANPEERRRYYAWVKNLEYDILKLPVPDCTLFLHVPIRDAVRLLAERSEFSAEKDSLDELHFQEKAHKAYEEMSELFPGDFTLVECMNTLGGGLLPPHAVHARVWSAVQPFLPARA